MSSANHAFVESANHAFIESANHARGAGEEEVADYTSSFEAVAVRLDAEIIEDLSDTVVASASGEAPIWNREGLVNALFSFFANGIMDGFRVVGYRDGDATEEDNWFSRAWALVNGDTNGDVDDDYYPETFSDPLSIGIGHEAVQAGNTVTLRFGTIARMSGNVGLYPSGNVAGGSIFQQKAPRGFILCWSPSPFPSDPGFGLILAAVPIDLPDWPTSDPEIIPTDGYNYSLYIDLEIDFRIIP